jgi:hypothetical protein
MRSRVAWQLLGETSPALRVEHTQNRRKGRPEFFDLYQIQYRFLDVALP